MDRPRITDAPGLTWRRNAHGWEARWRARTDLYKRGYQPATVRLWASTDEQPEPSEADIAFLRDRCLSLQMDMLVWGRGGIPFGTSFDGTLRSLSNCYRTDQDSPYHKTRFKTREYYDALCRRINEQHGDELVSEIRGRHVKRWHEEWAGGGKVTMAHALVGMVRTIINFGATILEDAECARLSGVLSGMRFEMPKPRDARLTAEQAIAIRAKAHEMGLPSIALAQAIQFDLMLRQKDVIGEWVPMSEPGMSDVTNGGKKWLRGLRWEEIDVNRVLRHITSKRQKAIEAPLGLAPMVMEELAGMALPERGPMIVSEATARPWATQEFRKQWRKIATAAGVPKTVRNMDTRAGAISEATDAGAELEHVRHAATHSDIAMTQRYSRGSEDKIATVMIRRAEWRRGKGGAS
jgi:hypothetical protein